MDEANDSPLGKVYKKIQECSICLSDMVKDIAVSKNCGHIFHRQCLVNS
jgi:hypothetical protein